jgi:hypothetical protein
MMVVLGPLIGEYDRLGEGIFGRRICVDSSELCYIFSACKVLVKGLCTRVLSHKDTGSLYFLDNMPCEREGAWNFDRPWRGRLSARLVQWPPPQRLLALSRRQHSTNQPFPSALRDQPPAPGPRFQLLKTPCRPPQLPPRRRMPT